MVKCPRRNHWADAWAEVYAPRETFDLRFALGPGRVDPRCFTSANGEICSFRPGQSVELCSSRHGSFSAAVCAERLSTEIRGLPQRSAHISSAPAPARTTVGRPLILICSPSIQFHGQSDRDCTSCLLGGSEPGTVLEQEDETAGGRTMCRTGTDRWRRR